MSTLRSILLHLDASPRSAVRLLLARELAAQHGASVTALYANPPSLFDLPFAVTDGAAEVLPLLRQIDTDRRNDARVLFDRAVSTATLPMQWRDLGAAPLIPGVAQHALCADLLVLGQHDGNDAASVGIAPDFIPSVLMASGRAALVIPYVDVCATLGREPLIAWKATREAARAVTAAIPLLQRARRIHLVAEAEGEAGAGGAHELEAYLHLHGVQALLQRHAAVRVDTPGDDLLSLAADAGADLLVMGCYGHSRARELVLGGASRTVLKSMTLPVLMAH